MPFVSAYETGTPLIAVAAAASAIAEHMIVEGDSEAALRHGASEDAGFSGVVVEPGIGLSTFGVGYNFGQELAVALSRIRGGNYFFIENHQRLDEIFTLDVDYRVTPLASDMHLEVTPGEGLQTTAAYGVQDWSAESGVVSMDVTTLFLSRNHGAIVIRLAGPVSEPL